MRLLNFSVEDKIRLGVKTTKGILDVEKSLQVLPSQIGEIPSTMKDVMNYDGDGVKILDKYVSYVLNSGQEDMFLNEDEIHFKSCVLNPGKILGIGLNYRAFLEKSNTPKPNFPHLFNKFSDSVRGHKEFVYIPANSEQVDYEAELAIVIGKKARMVSKEEALDYVFGYCNTNDVSARDFQYSTTSWIPGKCCDTFSPLGPYLVTKDEVEDPNNLSLRSYVNGELRQDANTNGMIFNIQTLISGVSQYFTLQPGDVILTGTPDGIIMCYPEDERVWLQDGDVVEVEVGNLGRLRTVFRKETI